MKVALAVLLCVVAVATAAPFSEDQYQFLFTKWVSHHGKAYAHDQFFSRYNVWKNNLNRIISHNEGNATWTMAMNQFGDMTGEEFKARYTGFVPRDYDHLRALNSKRSLQHIQAADSLDWRTKGAVTPVKNQQQCGSCWAFSATGSIEGAWQISSGKLVSVSEQQLVDCSGPQGNQGCNGGLMDYAFEYVIKKGLCAEGDYPYTAKDGQCKDSKCTPVVHISGYQDIPQGDENALLKAVNLGPVSIAIEADQSVFQFYSGGVLDSDQCGTNLDHGVLIVGYGTQGGKDYWIVKNSWGASWGQQGYILLARGKNECGLALAASYPTV